MSKGQFRNRLNDVLQTFVNECRVIFRDRGVMVIFLVAGVLYPILYNYIYRNEVVTDLPIAAVDLDDSSESRSFLKKVDAAREVKIAYHCQTLAQAEQLMAKRKIHGVVYIPSDYNTCLDRVEQATISIYVDMSSFLYYKNMVMATNFAMLDDLYDIQFKRYDKMGITGEQADQLVKAIPYQDSWLYNPGGGFSSFFLPAVLILIIQQTLFFGIAMVQGTQREMNSSHQLLPDSLTRGGVGRIMIGKSVAYFLLYALLTVYVVGIIPRAFNMPHLGNIWQLLLFMMPFILSVIFFSLTVSIVIRNRETGLVMFLFFTLILLFLSGFSWPVSNIPNFWRGFACLFPSTFAIRGYVAINSTGATLSTVRVDFLALWIQTIFYFITASMIMWREYHSPKLNVEQ